MAIVRAWSGWAAALVSTVAACSAAAVAWLGRSPEAQSRVAEALVLPVLAGVGALILYARPRHSIGRLACLGAALWASGSLPLELAVVRLLAEPGHEVWAGTAVVAFTVRGVGYVLLVTMLPLLFPTGSLPSPRWRPVLRATYVVLAVFALGSMLSPHPSDLRIAGVRNPFGVESLAVEVLFVVGYVLIFLVAGAGLLAVGLRWRRGDALMRQQVGWFATAMALPPLVVAIALLSSGDVPAWIYPLSVTGLATAIAVAVLQRRLYNLPLLVNRTVVYGLLTALVLGLYVLVVAGVGAMVGVRGAPWLSLLAAGAVAAAVQPMRAGLQRAVNRLTYGGWDEPYEVLDRLGNRLAAGGQPDIALAEVAAGVAQSLRLSYVAVLDSAGELLAEHGHPEQSVRELALVHQGEHVGVLRISSAPRPGGGARRSRDLRLLETLARQLAPAVSAVRLARDLRRSRERLAHSREEERRRLRRDLHDGLGQSLAALTLKVDTARNTVGRDPAVDAVLLGLRRDVQEAIADVRRVVEDLRPPALDKLGLRGAVEDLVARLASPGVRVEVDGSARLGALPAATEVAAYRIVQEALTNAARHSGAGCCGVSLDVEERGLRVRVYDDGCGFGRQPRSGNGLSTMRERAEEVGGRLGVTSTPGSGTVVEALLPVESPR